MEGIALAAHQWRYGVVLAEVLVAAGCVYLGVSAVAPPPAGAPIRVRHAASAPGHAAAGLATPKAITAPVVPGGAIRGRAFQAPNLTADWLSRLNADDYDLYSRQWQVLQLLMNGVRQYLEQSVVPRLLGH